MVCEFVTPTATFPKVARVGAAVTDDFVPVPLIHMVTREFEALLSSVSVEDCDCASVGENFTAKVTVWAAATVTGVLRPLSANCEAEVSVVPFSTTGLFPVFVAVMVTVLLLFTGTAPKLKYPGLNVSRPCACDGEAPRHRAAPKNRATKFVYRIALRSRGDLLWKALKL